MLKRCLALVILLCVAFPVGATAASWTLNTWVKSAGGTMSSRNNAAQTSTNGSVFKSYTTHASLPVTVTANNGYSITNVTKNGVTVASSGSSYSTTVSGMTAQSVSATFSPRLLSITASAGMGGAVTPTSVSNTFYGQKALTAYRFIFTPNTGFTVAGITGVPAGATQSAPAANGAVTVTLPVNFLFTSDIALIGTFNGPPIASAGTAQTVAPNTSVTLAGSVVSGTATTYAWTKTSGPPATLSGVNTLNLSFTPSVEGTYQFQLVVSGPSGTSAPSTVAVFVTSDPATMALTQCVNCHNGNGIGIGTYPKWTGSPHNSPTSPVMCYNCHTGANTGSHPGAALSLLGNICRNCHLDGQGNVPNHPFPIGTTTCVTCHDAHSTTGTLAGTPQGQPHFNNLTGNKYPASYVTSKGSCNDCHTTAAGNQAVRLEWAGSGHADTVAQPWIDYDFKTRAGCVQCHTTTGFVTFSSAKVTAAWGVATDKTKEVLTCRACHSDVTAGIVRVVKPATPFSGDAYVNRNVGTSNICLDCHIGRNTGKSVTSTNFTNQSFITPHYLAAGGILHATSAYLFPGQTYGTYSTSSHRVIGMYNANGTGSAGPCVGCHMTSAAKHSFEPVTVDNAGAINGIVSTACVKCHGSVLGVTELAADQASFKNALGVLNAALSTRGFTYASAYPYFSNKNWGTGQAGANTMGAAYNYVLFLKEPGAYAHNPSYTKKVLTDSIDAAWNNGTISGDLQSVLSEMVGAGAISQEQADGMTSFNASSSCVTCHTNTSGSHPKHLASDFNSLAISCADCHSATAASNTALASGTATHIDNQTEVVLASGGNYGAGTCSNVYCHSNGAGAFQSPAWGSAALNCASCHPLATLGGAHAAHIGDLMNSVSFYGYTTNGSTGSAYRFGCANCHPVAIARHLDGQINVTLQPEIGAGSLKNLNTTISTGGIGNSGSGISGTTGTSVVCSASYCHSNGWVGGTLVYANSPDWYGPAYSGDKCAMCHGNSPNSTIAGSPAHGAHVISIHTGKVYDGSGDLLPTAAPAGTSAGHGDAAQATTINCNVCHSTTVTNSANDNNTACVSCHMSAAKGVPAVNTASHVNGKVNISFAGSAFRTKAQLRNGSYDPAIWTRSTYKVDGGSYDQGSISGASWNSGTCANVACHNSNSVKWSDGKLSCVACHTTL